MKPRLKNGYVEVIDGKSQNCNFLSMGLLILNSKLPQYENKTKNEEIAIVIINGNVDVNVGNNEFKNIGRKSVFEKPADVVYVPTDTEYKIKIKDHDGNAKIALCKSKADRHMEPLIVRSDYIETVKRGKCQWKRNVRNILVDNVEGKVDKIILGETINEPGEWSGYPPHKHTEKNPPDELPFEEIYYYEFDIL